MCENLDKQIQEKEKEIEILKLEKEIEKLKSQIEDIKKKIYPIVIVENWHYNYPIYSYPIITCSC